MTDTYTIDAAGKATILKDPEAKLDYSFDWSAWLDPLADTIASHVVTVPAGIALDTSSADVTNKIVTAWISGGSVGTTYAVECKITTAAGRIDERTIYIKVKER